MEESEDGIKESEVEIRKAKMEQKKCEPINIYIYIIFMWNAAYVGFGTPGSPETQISYIFPLFWAPPGQKTAQNTSLYMAFYNVFHCRISWNSAYFLLLTYFHMAKPKFT